MDHFGYIVTQLDSDDLVFLNTLFTNEALSKFQSIPRSHMQIETKLKDFTMRKVVNRLETLCFIETVKSNHKHRYFLTQFGLEAINKIIERAEDECVME